MRYMLCMRPAGLVRCCLYIACSDHLGDASRPPKRPKLPAAPLPFHFILRDCGLGVISRLFLWIFAPSAHGELHDGRRHSLLCSSWEDASGDEPSADGWTQRIASLRVWMPAAARRCRVYGISLPDAKLEDSSVATSLVPGRRPPALDGLDTVRSGASLHDMSTPGEFRWGRPPCL